MAQESDAAPLTADVLPEGWELLPLPGHFLDMVGFRTPDDVVYLADCLASRETLDKYGIAFLYDVNAYLATLERVKAMSAALFVPSHAAATEDIRRWRSTTSTAPTRRRSVSPPCVLGVTFDELLSAVFAAYGLAMSLPQYALMGSTVRSYLSYLMDAGQVAAQPSGTRLIWQRI